MTPDGKSLRFRLVTEQSELFAIADQWRELLRSSAAPQPMNDPSWLLIWWRHYGVGTEIAIGLLYDDDVLVGLAPLCLRNYLYRLGLMFRRLQFMGRDANENDGVCSEYMGFVARRGYENCVARDFVDLIHAGKFGLSHEVVLGAMDNNNPTMSFAEARFTELGLSCEQRGSSQGYYIQLPQTWEDYLNSMSANRRHCIEDCLAQFTEWAWDRGWKLEHASTPEAFKQGVNAFVSLHEERWRGESSAGTGPFSSQRFTAFHRDYIAAQAELRTVDVACLTIGGAQVAIIYTIRNGKKVLAYQHAQIKNTPPNVRILHVINALMIKEAIERGDEEFDFLGGEDSYKSDFATHTRPIATLRAAKLTAREFVRLQLVGVKHGVVTALDAGRALRRPPMVPAAQRKVAFERRDA